MAKFAALLASAFLGIVGTAEAAELCANSLPNTYDPVAGWGHQSRPWAPVSAMAVDAHDNIWVVDRCGADSSCTGDHANINPIWELAPDGHALKNFGAGLFVKPHSITLDKDGNLWVTDYEALDGKGNQVTKLSPDGKVLLRIGQPGVKGEAPDQFTSPTDVAFAPNGDLFITDGHSAKDKGRVHVYSPDGKPIRTFGVSGTAPGQLSVPHAIAFDKEGRVFIANRGNNTVEIFGADGSPIASWAQFGRNNNVFFDRNNTLYVATERQAASPPCNTGVRIVDPATGVAKVLVTGPEVEGLAVDSKGDIYGAQITPPGAIYKYVPKKQP